MSMSLRDLNEATDRLLELLDLGKASVRRSSAYVDYVALEFAMFADDHKRVDLIRAIFGNLCRRHGWEVCRVSTTRGNSVCVTLQASEVLTTGDARMPVDDGHTAANKPVGVPLGAWLDDATAKAPVR